MEVKYGGIPAREAINHLREKLNITTQHWDDILGDMHAKAFTVAGATKLALLEDLREAVRAAVDDGESIGQFRQRFNEIVAQHGWTYKGEQGWRTRVIYDTNLRTAHMAGKWEQFQRTKATRPYLMYQTAGDSRVRPEHANWDGVILPVDHPFWRTHYPPNDWGCRCTIVSLSERDLIRKGLKVSDDPVIEKTERVNTRSGEVYGEVPEGIGTGWDYNVGEAWLSPEKTLGDALISMPVPLKDQFFDNYKPLVRALNDQFKVFASGNTTSDKAVVGYINPVGLGNVRLKTAAITISRTEAATLPANLPKLINAPLAVLETISVPTERYIIYVLDQEGDDLLFIMIDPGNGEVIESGSAPRLTLAGEGYRTLKGAL